MRKLALSIILAVLSVAGAQAQVGPPTTVGGMTRETCSAVAVTLSSAYAAGNEVGPLLTLANSFRSAAQGAPDQGGVLQSLRLTFSEAQTAEFDVYQFTSNPSNSTWTNKATPAINAADVNAVNVPIKLGNAASGLGTHTVYGADAIGRSHVAGSTSDYFVIITTGTPTFTVNPQFCATYLLD